MNRITMCSNSVTMVHVFSDSKEVLEAYISGLFDGFDYYGKNNAMCRQHLVSYVPTVEEAPEGKQEAGKYFVKVVMSVMKKRYLDNTNAYRLVSGKLTPTENPMTTIVVGG